MNNIYIICLVIIIILIFLFCYYKKYIEKYENYFRPPYNHIDNGSTPLTYYEYPTYREPYEYPYTFFKSYPVPHLSNYEDII